MSLQLAVDSPQESTWLRVPESVFVEAIKP